MDNLTTMSSYNFSGSNITTTESSPSVDNPVFTCRVFAIIISGVMFPALCLISTIGNPLSFITWYKIAKRKGYNSNIILILFLAVADTIVLIPHFLVMGVTLIAMETGKGIDFYHKGGYAYVAAYIWPFGSSAQIVTNLLTTLIAVHRYCILRHPFWWFTQKITTVKSTTIQCIVIVVMATLFRVPRYLEFDVIDYIWPNGDNGTYLRPTPLRSNANYQLYYSIVADNALTAIGPLIVTFTFTIRIIVTLLKAKNARKDMTATSSTSTNNSSSSEAAVSKALLTIAIIFIICQIPNAVLRLLIAFNTGAELGCGKFLFFFNPLCIMLLDVNSAINIFVYAKISAEFRAQLKWMFCCKKQQRPAAGHDTSTKETMLTSVSGTLKTVSSKTDDGASIPGSTAEIQVVMETASNGTPKTKEISSDETPKAKETASDGTPKANGTPDGTPKANGTSDGAPKANGTPDGTPKANGTSDGTPKANGTSDGTPKANVTPDGTPKANGTACDETHKEKETASDENYANPNGIRTSTERTSKVNEAAADYPLNYTHF